MLLLTGSDLNSPQSDDNNKSIKSIRDRIAS